MKRAISFIIILLLVSMAAWLPFGSFAESVFQPTQRGSGRLRPVGAGWQRNRLSGAGRKWKKCDHRREAAAGNILMEEELSELRCGAVAH